MSRITRFGISMNTQLLKQFDSLIKRMGYANRSEAIRDLVRERLVREEWQDETVETVGTVTLIYDHHRRDLMEHLVEHQHQQHDSVISTMHVHLDPHNCLEVLAVRGTARDVKRFADRLISTKGVKHGKLVMTSTGKNL
jgi:CopG family nickel-responsive transcriptional regulator